MSWQALLLDPLLIAKAVDSLMAPPPPVRRSAAAQLLMTLAAVLACLSMAAIAVGIYFVLRETYTLQATALMMGIGGIAVSGLMAGTAWAIFNARMIKNKIRGKVIHHKVRGILETVSDEWTAPIRAYPKTAAALAALLGLILAEKYGKKGADMLHDIMNTDAGREIQSRVNQLLH